jgi:hypothetical protein
MSSIALKPSRQVADRDTPATPLMLTVCDGKITLGFIMRRGREGAEAFTYDQQSLGLFRNEATAATAIWRHARGQVRS